MAWTPRDTDTKIREYVPTTDWELTGLYELTFSM